MSEEEPDLKRLRSCEPDLLVIIGNENKQEYRYHSQVMASLSTFIDTQLATPMKESQSRSIYFPDVTPELWECMVKYLDPSEALTLSIETAMKLAPLYDKYAFMSGIKLCDRVISPLFEKNIGKFKKAPSHDMNLLIDAFLIASDANLSVTMQHAADYFRGALCSMDPFGRIMFSVAHIEKLMPLIVNEQLLIGNDEWSDDEIKSRGKSILFCLLTTQYSNHASSSLQYL
jgi:hypothetical protein